MKNIKNIHDYLSALGKKGGAVQSLAKKKSSPENGKLGGRPLKKDSKLWVLTADGKCGEYYTSFSGNTSTDFQLAITWRTKGAAEKAREEFSKSYGIGINLIGISRICDIECG